MCTGCVHAGDLSRMSLVGSLAQACGVVLYQGPPVQSKLSVATLPPGIGGVPIPTKVSRTLPCLGPS